METLQWLDYFTDGVSDVHVNAGKKIYTRRINPDYIPKDVSAFVDADATITEPASEEEVTTGEFFYELSKILTTKTQWEQFFSHHGIALSVQGAKSENQFRLHAENGTNGRAYMTIRRIPYTIQPLSARKIDNR